METNRFKFCSFFVLFALSACVTAAQRGTAAIVPAGINAKFSSEQVNDGSLLALSLQIPSDLPRRPVIGDFQGREIVFFSADDFNFQAFVPVPYGQTPGPVDMTVRLGEGENLKSFQLSFTVVDGSYPSETLTVPPKMVTPNKKDMKRIRKEQLEIGKIYNTLTPEKFWMGPFTLPIESSVTSVFGSKRVYNGELQGYHGGLDLKANVNTRVFAAAAGKVVLAKNLYYTGNTVFLDHGYGLITVYAHLNKLRVKFGQKVKKKQLLGLSGKTGRVTGPHLHWQVVVQHIKVNPLDAMKVIQ
jgi:murein DD-endopeptidase MepM/ murein hydrolase activator NlpD